MYRTLSKEPESVTVPLEIGKTRAAQKAWIKEFCCHEFEPWEDQEDFTTPSVRHLLFHCYPTKSNNAWRRNIDQLVERMGQFRGHKLVAIALDSQTVDPQEVERQFNCSDIEYVYCLNDPRYREVVSMFPMWSRLPDEPGHITFYCHSKGVTRNKEPHLWRWVELMYSTCLDRPEVVDRMLENHCTVGTFKKLGKCFSGSRQDWHYSGSFYWIRNYELFRRPWKVVDMHWWGVESWPAIIFSVSQAGALLVEDVVPQLDLYQPPVMERMEHLYQGWLNEVPSL